MVSEDLLNYIRIQQAQGFTPSQIKGFLKKNGYGSKVVEDHFSVLFPRKKPLNPFIIVLSIIGLLILVAGITYASWYFSQPVCGNGILEDGETPETCCIDAGCLGDETCEDSVCTSPSCGYCQFLRGTACFDYDCCENTDCGSGFSCQNNRCKEIICGYCQFIDENKCTSYECCESSQCGSGTFCVDNTCQDANCSSCQYVAAGVCLDYACCGDIGCNDSDNNTIDICNDPSSLNAICTHELPPECDSDDDCDDEINSTLDFCFGSPRKCVFQTITSCKDDDNYCYPGCKYSQDDDCEKPDECQLNVDCDDDNSATTDTCVGTPKECEHKLITECLNNDDYCPLNCDWKKDDDCQTPDGDLIIEDNFKVLSYGADNDVHETNCARDQVLVFNITNTFSSLLKDIIFELYVDGELATLDYSSVDVLREVGSVFDTSFDTGTSLAYLDFKGSVAGKEIIINLFSEKEELDYENNNVTRIFDDQLMDLVIGNRIQEMFIYEDEFMVEGASLLFGSYDVTLLSVASDSVLLSVNDQIKSVPDGGTVVFELEGGFTATLKSKLYIESMDDNSATLTFEEPTGSNLVGIFRSVIIEECPDFEIDANDGLFPLNTLFGGFNGLEGVIIVEQPELFINITVDSTNIVEETNEENNLGIY